MKLKPDHLTQAFTVLKDIALFKGCSNDQLTSLVAQLEVFDYPKGKVILMEQEISRTLYILIQGSVGIWRRHGAEKTLVATLNAVNFFGEMSMFTELPANALVKAESDCKAYALPRTGFDAVVQKFPDLSPAIQKRIEELKTERPPIVKAKPADEETK